DRIICDAEDDGDDLRRPLGRPGRWRSTRQDEVNLEAHQFRREGWKLVSPVRVAPLEFEMRPLDPAELPHRVRKGLRRTRGALSKVADPVDSPCPLRLAGQRY